MPSLLYDEAALSAQIRRQIRYAWRMEDIPWDLGVDRDRPLLPLDADAIAFPGASAEQKLVISQWMGLTINATIAEMEGVITHLRDVGWRELLRSYPVNPEMERLGDLFFEEEDKHSLAFNKYNSLFCKSLGLDEEIVQRLMPRAFGSLFLKSIVANASRGGHAFWWVVASVEEISIILYRQLRREKDLLDPLFHWLHLKHMEEESRHHNYAFLMLELIAQRQFGLRRYFHKKADFLLAQAMSSGWVLGELAKIRNIKQYEHDHEFFSILSSCLPLLDKLGTRSLLVRLFTQAPFISLVLNPRSQPLTRKTAEEHGVLKIPLPLPKLGKLEVPLALRKISRERKRA